MSGARSAQRQSSSTWGGEPELIPAAACRGPKPTQVMVGEPVTVIVTPSNFNPKHTVSYTFTTTGGKLTSKDASTAVDTTGMTGGSYTVTATATDSKKKKNNVASCNAQLLRQRASSSEHDLLGDSCGGSDGNRLQHHLHLYQPRMACR